MRLAFWTAAAGVAMVYLGLVLAAMLLFGFLPALAGGLVVGGVVLVTAAETVMTPKAEPARWPR